jgi:CubicO group peptidase (beta-lactamase class C family)
VISAISVRSHADCRHPHESRREAFDPSPDSRRRPVFAVTLTLTAAVPNGRPEDVGLSSERLQRITDVVQRYIAAKEIAGAVTVVTRRGKVARFEAQGMMDLESKAPMRKDGIFRIASMSKPVTGVAILILVEEGKVRLNDPVSRFIPEFKDTKVAVAKPGPEGSAPAATGRGRGAAPQEIMLTAASRPITVRDLLTHVRARQWRRGFTRSQPHRAAESEREPRRACSEAGRRAARLPARDRVALQRARRHRYARTDRRDRIRANFRSVPAAADLRAARHEGHRFLPN